MNRFGREEADALVLALAEHCSQSPGQRASLRRNQGNSLDEVRNVGWFRHFMARWRDENKLDNVPSDGLVFLVATLMADDRKVIETVRASNELPKGKRNLGASLDDVERTRDAGAHDAKMKLKPDPQRRESRFERRLRILLDAELAWDGTGELAFRLRQCVRLVLAERDGMARIAWGQLLLDLSRWNWDNRPSRRDWAQSFYNDPRAVVKPVVVAPPTPDLDSDIPV
jgi:CRISPR-associated protein Cse2 (CRISPR_cse2)